MKVFVALAAAEFAVSLQLRGHMPSPKIFLSSTYYDLGVDFVIRRTRDEVDAIECKWDPRHFEADALKAFRIRYPGGRNYLVCPDAGPGYEKHIDGLDVVVVNPRQWLGKYAEPTG